MDIEVVSMSWLLKIILQWILEYMHLFKSWFSLDRCPGVGLLDQMVVLFLLFRLVIVNVQNHKWFPNPLQSGSFYIPPLKPHYQCHFVIKVSWPKTSLPMASLSFKLMNNLPGLFCLNFYYILMWINSYCLLKLLLFLPYMAISYQTSWLIPPLSASSMWEILSPLP